MGNQCFKGCFESLDVQSQSSINTNPRYSAATESIMRARIQSMPLESLTEVIDSLKHEVVKMMLKCKKDICINPELFSFVDEYFDNNLEIMEFGNALEDCLERARDIQLTIDVAVKHYDNEMKEQFFDGKRYTKTLQELKNFKDLGNPLYGFFQKFQETFEKQNDMLEKLQLRRRKLRKKAKSINSWRTVLFVTFVLILSAVLILSVVTVAVHAVSPVVSALFGALTGPIGLTGKWINSLWKKYKTELKGEIKVMDSMHFRTNIAVQDLDNNIGIHVKILEDHMESLLQYADFALREEDAVKFVIEKMKKELPEFSERIYHLTIQTASCQRNIIKAMLADYKHPISR